MRKITVAMVLFPGFQLLDIAGPRDAFAEVRILSKGECEYEMLTVGTTRGMIPSSSGLTTQPDRTIFDPCPPFDTVIVPGGLGVFEVLEDSTLSDWLARQQKLSRRIAAVCNGAFAFGAAGLIDNRTVATHWMDVARLSVMFPKARVEPDLIHVKDGNVYTTAGVTAGIDLALVMIEEDFGRQMALDVAKYLIVYVRRAGGQSQFSPLLETQASDNTLVQDVQQYLLANLNLAHSVESLAKRLNMSPRNLSRIFSRECGIGLIAFLSNARIDAARRYLESTNRSISEIARRCGYESADALRRTFIRRLQVSPLEYRHRFRSGGADRRGSSTA
ncbi:GlxA family transcriptional regulator [Paraburkholderia sp. BCC1885]|uniref:GlxA family transcriptional regulator n=1 Tax=Paraburkholderia sp. BCC1885 TaxID=2562669 RepID=UPI0011832618|nr:GlxA family transcriptional regulator [Paraburkholderia sp. BCC1885]